MIQQVKKRLEEKNIKISIDNKAKELIIKNGTDTNYGARPLRRAIQTMLEDKIAETILDGKLKDGDTAKVTVKEDKIIIETK